MKNISFYLLINHIIKTCKKFYIHLFMIFTITFWYKQFTVATYSDRLLWYFQLCMTSSTLEVNQYFNILDLETIIKQSKRHLMLAHISFINNFEVISKELQGRISAQLAII